MSLSSDQLFATIAELVLCHSPSGAESEINHYLLQKFQALQVEAWLDAADNLVAKIPGRDSTKAIARSFSSSVIIILG
jgi:putative aminopeptidase FrvX